MLLRLLLEFSPINFLHKLKTFRQNKFFFFIEQNCVSINILCKWYIYAKSFKCTFLEIMIHWEKSIGHFWLKQLLQRINNISLLKTEVTHQQSIKFTFHFPDAVHGIQWFINGRFSNRMFSGHLGLLERHELCHRTVFGKIRWLYFCLPSSRHRNYIQIYCRAPVHKRIRHAPLHRCKRVNGSSHTLPMHHQLSNKPHAFEMPRLFLDNTPNE